MRKIYIVATVKSAINYTKQHVKTVKTYGKAIEYIQQQQRTDRQYLIK